MYTQPNRVAVKVPLLIWPVSRFMNLTADPLVPPAFVSRKPKPVNSVSSSPKVKSFGLLNKRSNNFFALAIPLPINSIYQNGKYATVF
jgi:hypothetical protein